MIEYGMYPEFMLTHQPAEDMIRTTNSWYFSTEWTQWLEPAAKEMNQVRDEFGYLHHQFVVSHDVITKDVRRVRYEDGSEMLLNHGTEAYRGPEGTVGPLSYVLRKGGTR